MRLGKGVREIDNETVIEADLISLSDEEFDKEWEQLLSSLPVIDAEFFELIEDGNEDEDET